MQRPDGGYFGFYLLAQIELAERNSDFLVEGWPSEAFAKQTNGQRKPGMTMKHSVLFSRSMQGLRTGWEQKLRTDISDQLWKAVIEKIHKFLPSLDSLIQLKILHRLHHCKVKFFPNTSPPCDKLSTWGVRKLEDPNAEMLLV